MSSMLGTTSSIPLRTYEARIQEIVSELNGLLGRLALPIVLDSPSDLTPSLLVAVLESILQERLPIPQDIRDAKNFSSKVQAVKVFLGVLENDVVDGDVDLSNVDPRMLALGEWDEVVLIAETLCAVGRKFALLPSGSDASSSRGEEVKTSVHLPSNLEDMSSDPFWVPPQKPAGEQSGVASLSEDEASDELHILTNMRSLSIRSGSTTNQSTSRSSASFGSILQTSAPDASSATTALSAAHSSPFPSSPLIDDITSSSPSQAHRTATRALSTPNYSFSHHKPRCIHEVPDDPTLFGDESPGSPSQLRSTGTPLCCHCSSRTFAPKPKSPPVPVRRSGWIEPVDHEEELRSFELMETRRRNHANIRASPSESPSLRSRYAGLSAASVSSPSSVMKRHNSPSQHTLALMNERAKLLEELASVKASKLRR